MCLVRQRTDRWMSCRLGWTVVALPFMVEQFYGVFRDYNMAVGPAQWFLVALAIAALVAAVPRSRFF